MKLALEFDGQMRYSRSAVDCLSVVGQKGSIEPRGASISKSKTADSDGLWPGLSERVLLPPFLCKKALNVSLAL